MKLAKIITVGVGNVSLKVNKPEPRK